MEVEMNLRLTEKIEAVTPNRRTGLQNTSQGRANQF